MELNMAMGSVLANASTPNIPGALTAIEGSKSSFWRYSIAHSVQSSNAEDFNCRINTSLFSTRLSLRKRNRLVVNSALSGSAVSTLIAVAVVGLSVVGLRRLNKEKIDAILPKRKPCSACEGSGLCSACKGEGFLPKYLSPEAAARARSNARDAATRYTAGLPKKWNYCTNCSGSRGCQECQGRGWIEGV